MDVHDEYIPEATFATCLDRLPQVCVEVVVCRRGAVLLARRRTAPAAGEWFWPGARLFKGEQLEDAVHRIAREELDIAVELEERLGVHAHFWTESSVSDVSERHTVNVIYRVSPESPEPEVTLDDQHSDYRWLSEPESGLHEYVRAYLVDYDLLD